MNTDRHHLPGLGAVALTLLGGGALVVLVARREPRLRNARRPILGSLGAELVVSRFNDACTEVEYRNAGVTGTGTAANPFRGSYRTRPGAGGVPVQINWALWRIGRDWRTDIEVNGETWAEDLPPDQVVKSLTLRLSRTAAGAVHRAIRGQIALAKHTTPPFDDAAARNAPRVDLADFARTVLAIADGIEPNPTAEGLARGRFGTRKVFLAAVRRGLARTAYTRLSRADVNELLLKAHRDGLLSLARADLVGAMDPAELRDSEVKLFGSSFHFVESEP